MCFGSQTKKGFMSRYGMHSWYFHKSDAYFPGSWAGKQLQDKMKFLKESLMNVECAPGPALRQHFSFISEMH